MVEIFLILLQFLIIFFFLSFNICILNDKNLSLRKLSIPENIAFNSIIFLNFILFLSFLNFNLNKIILIYVLFLFFLITIYLYKFKNLHNYTKDNLLNFSLLFFASSIIFLEVANNLVIGWDAQKFWIYKTLNFYNENTITNLPNLPNPWYPYLGSLSWSFFWKLSFIQSEYSGRLFYVFLYLTSLLLIIGNLNLSKLYKVKFYIILIIISYDYTYHSHWSMFSGYQDILVFSLVMIAMHFLYQISKNTDKSKNLDILKILLICNLLIWTKQEGFVISLSLILTLILFFKINLNKKIYILAIFLLIIFLRFFIFEFYNLNPTNFQHTGYNDITILSIIEKISLERIFTVSKYFFLGLFSNYLILIGLFTLLFINIEKQNLKRIFYVIFFLVFNIFVFCVIYLITDTDLKHMLETGVDRIIFQFSPSALLIFIELYNSKKINLRKFNL